MLLNPYFGTREFARSLQGIVTETLPRGAMQIPASAISA